MPASLQHRASKLLAAAPSDALQQLSQLGPSTHSPGMEYSWLKAQRQASHMQVLSRGQAAPQLKGPAAMAASSPPLASEEPSDALS